MTFKICKLWFESYNAFFKYDSEIIVPDQFFTKDTKRGLFQSIINQYYSVQATAEATESILSGIPSLW